MLGASCNFGGLDPVLQELVVRDIAVHVEGLAAQFAIGACVVVFLALVEVTAIDVEYEQRLLYMFATFGTLEAGC